MRRMWRDAPEGANRRATENGRERMSRRSGEGCQGRKEKSHCGMMG